MPVYAVWLVWILSGRVNKAILPYTLYFYMPHRDHHLVQDRCLRRFRLNILGLVAEAGEAPADLRSHCNLGVQVLPSQTIVTLESTLDQDNIDVILIRDLSNNSAVYCVDCRDQYLVSNSLIYSCREWHLEANTRCYFLSDVDTTAAG